MAYKPFDLTGKVALVTGGNGGIGFGMVEALAQSGADVVIWGSNPKKNADAEAKLKNLGVRVMSQVVDVADEEAVRAGMVEAVSKMGRIDTVIANAGIGGGATSFAEFPTETYRRVLAVNLDGVFFTFREACKHMVERAGSGDKAGGSLVVISSLSAYDGAPRNEAYAATKGAVISMIRAIAVEHARYGVRANAILPGWIATDMTAGAQGNDKFNDAVIKRVPARRWGKPADFGGMAVYLASDASSFHTGDSFLIDGGYGIF
ncbi:SDR family oxidoreductase [Phenylobacterium sp. LH3H17]|uniref:SDR family NAD(P)-dependent oxidoreductase n=1 Tax=Phenylobacterium sp. LH3H17 TaxID=2903901 RepID=UPI0020C9D050|nr:SDR family oxidoreductase [Phenylobacterium sp. LH3H17]UTP39043.1 SDR family oxidoreductase [Phenylobacterium sp. LH3H17]